MKESRTRKAPAARSGLIARLGASLVLAVLAALLVVMVGQKDDALAMPSKTTTCLTGTCHGNLSTAATLSWGMIYNGTNYPSNPTSLTVPAGSSFELEVIANNMTDSAHGNNGMSFLVGLPSVTPTAWSIANGTAANSGITGWNTVWDATGGWNWRTGQVLSTSATWPTSPNGYSIDWTGSTWATSAGAAYDTGTANAADKDLIADKMGTDVVVNVPADTPAGTYTINIAGIGHYYTNRTNKGYKSQAITVTVTASTADTTKPVVSAGFAATTPSLSKTIPVSGFAATDNTGVTGYMITTSSTAPLSGDAGWLGAAPTSYTVAADGSYTLYPWAKDAAGNVSLVYGSPVTVTVDSLAPSVSSTVPANSATGIAANSTVTLNFSENMDCTTVTTSTVTISPSVTWTRTSCSGAQAVFTPASQASTTSYSVTVGTGVKDTAGNTMLSPYLFSYTTSTPITLPDTTLSAPAANAVLSATPVTISGTAVAGTNPLGSVEVSTNNGSSWSAATGTAAWTFSWTLPSEDYVSHTILARAKDNASNADSTPASVTVRVDNVAPAGLANAAPANGGGNLALATTLSSSTATDANVSAAVQYFFEIATDSGFTTGVQQSGWQTGTTFAPTLAAATTYYWHVKAKDAAGNVSANTTTWSFTTIGPTAPNAPSAAQYKTDGVTAIAQGGTTTEGTVLIKSTVSDANNDNVSLQVEVITNGNTFAGVATCSSVAVTSGSVATATCTGLADGLSYKWRARTSDGTLNSAWVDFGGSDPDFTVSLSNTAPLAPTSLAQYQADGATAIASGGAATTNVVVIGATVDGGNSDPVLLEVDLNNDGVADCASAYVTGPATAKATCGGLADGSYDWRVRAKDNKGSASAWTAFTGTPDFTVATGLDVGVDTTAPTDGAASLASGDGFLNLSWTAATDSGAGLDPASTYKVVKATGSTAPADCTGTAVYTGNGTSYFDTAVVNGTTYAYRVCAYDKVTNISAGATVSGSPSAIALPETAIGAPANASTVTGSSYNVTGTATAGGNPLNLVQVSTNNGSSWSTATGTGSWSFAWTLAAEDYVAHTILAKAQDTLGYADATPASVTVRVDNVAPAGLANATPANGATAVPTTSTLTSSTATDGNTSAAVQYNFAIATDSGFTTGLQQSGWQSATSFSPTLAPATTYYWHVAARDAAGNTTAYTTTWSFTSGVVPPDTTISAPAAGTVNSTSPVSITGAAVAGTLALGSVQVSTNNGSTWTSATGTSSWSFSWTLPAEDYVTHVIQAKAQDSSNNADTTPASVTVIVDNVAPAGLANSTPTNGATAVATSTALVSGAATDANTTAAVQYFFEIATNNTFTTGVQQSGWQTSTSYSPTLSISTTYYWHVKAKDAAGNTSAYSTTWSFATAAATTMVLNGAGETNVTIAPGATTTDLDAFVLQTQAGTDTITGVTVTLASGSYAGIGLIEVTDGNGTTFGSATNPAGNVVAITLSTPITATTTATPYVIEITPKAATAMPAVPGATYTVTGTVTAITSSNPKSYADSTSATVTIDNLSPGNVTSAGGSAGVASNALFWTNPVDSDFSKVVVLRRAGAAVADIPVEGLNYLEGNTVGSSTVAYVGNIANFTDGPLLNGTAYYYKIFALDTRGNYSSAGTALGPYTPARTAWANNYMLHNSTNTGSTKWSANGGWGEPGKKYGAFSCSTCHTMDSTNIKRIRTSISTGDGSNWASNNAASVSVTVLNPATDSGSDTTHTTSTRICEVCHSQTSYHKYNNTASHNGVVDCTSSCHLHASAFKPSGGSCTGCHNSPKGSRQQILGATLGNTGDDFVRPSRHIKNTTVKNVDCIICHAEGDTTSTETSVKQVGLHATGGMVMLRNVDSQANPGTAGTNFWNWPGKRNGGATITSADRDNMDRFCLGCHDSDGALTISVNAGGTGVDTGASTTRRLTPFNPSDGGTPLNVKAQFNSGNAVGSAYASHHNLNIYTKRYTAAYASTYASRGGWTGTSKDGVAMTWDTGLHCSDCHLNESNAHGARNATRMLQDKNGADAAAVNASDGTGTFVCYRCHLSTVYNNTNVTVTGKARIEHSSLDNMPFTAGSYNDHGIVCLNCHMGGGVNNIGGIHGNNRSITTLTQGATKGYRFMYGAEMGPNISDANWSTTTTPSCYTASSTWGGACNKHDGSAGTGRIGTPTYSRPLQ